MCALQKQSHCPTYVFCSSAVCQLFTDFKTVFIGVCGFSVFSRLFICNVGQRQITTAYSSFSFECNIREYAGKKCLGTIALA